MILNKQEPIIEIQTLNSLKLDDILQCLSNFEDEQFTNPNLRAREVHGTKYRDNKEYVIACIRSIFLVYDKITKEILDRICYHYFTCLCQFNKRYLDYSYRIKERKGSYFIILAYRLTE